MRRRRMLYFGLAAVAISLLIVITVIANQGSDKEDLIQVNKEQENHTIQPSHSNQPDEKSNDLVEEEVIVSIPEEEIELMEEYVPGQPRPIKPSDLVGNLGALVVLPVPPHSIKDSPAKYERMTSGDQTQMVFVDQPEVVYGEGILFRDTVKDRVRVYTYHVNGDADKLKFFPVYLVNHSDKDIDVTILREALTGPGVTYAPMGQHLLAEWFEPNERQFVVPAGEKVILDPKLKTTLVHKNGMLHGLYDFEVSSEVEVIVAATFNMTKDISELEDIHAPLDEPMRGLFPVTDRHVTWEASEDEVSTIMLASGQGDDTWEKGYDFIDDVEREVMGNYGVIYHIDTALKVTKPTKYRFFLANAYDAAGCTSASTVRITSEKHKYEERGEIILAPRDGVLELTSGKQASFLGEIIVFPEEDRELRLDFVPPGGSCLALKLVAWPTDPDEKEDSTGIIGLEKALNKYEPVNVFYDEFDAPSSYWEFSNMMPEYIDGQIVYEGQVYGNAFAGSLDADNYAFEVKAMLEESSNSLSMFVRSQYLWKGYQIFVTANERNGTISINKQNGSWDNSRLLAQGSNADIKPGEWFTLRVEVKDNVLDVYVNGVKALQTKDNANSFPQGRVGWRAEYNSLRLEYAKMEKL